MTGVEIRVSGQCTVKQAPEFARVRLAVVVVDADQAHAYSAVTAAAAAVANAITPLVDAQRGPVTRWSSDQLRTEAVDQNPRARDAIRKYRAAVAVRVRFVDFDALTRFLDAVAPLAGVQIQHIEWGLSRASQQALIEQARGAALRDARDRAAFDAHSLDLGDVRPVEIIDVGSEGSHHRLFALSRSSGSDGDRPGLAFVPQDVSVSVQVEARFVTG